MYLDISNFDFLKGKALFYPCSGVDCDEFFQYFSEYINTFWFSDIGYKLKGKAKNKITIPRAKFKLSGYGSKNLPYAPPPEGSNCKDIRAKIYKWNYKRISDDEEININFRYGCAQFTLDHFKDSEIGVFVHRGDGMVSGEGSSNVMFLGNRRKRHEPISNLYDKLYPKLAETALIISDGSNTTFKQLKKYHSKHDLTGSDIYQELNEYEGHGLKWKCVGYASDKYGPTFVWKINKV